MRSLWLHLFGCGIFCDLWQYLITSPVDNVAEPEHFLSQDACRPRLQNLGDKAVLFIAGWWICNLKALEVIHLSTSPVRHGSRGASCSLMHRKMRKISMPSGKVAAGAMNVIFSRRRASVARASARFPDAAAHSSKTVAANIKRSVSSVLTRLSSVTAVFTRPRPKAEIRDASSKFGKCSGLPIRSRADKHYNL